MALNPFRHRPRIVLLAPSMVCLGDELVATVRLVVKRTTVVSRLTAEWIGQEEARFGSGEYVARLKYRSPSGPIRILDKTALDPGEHEYELRMVVPANMSPSYAGQRCSTRHLLRLRLAIPWWLDRQTSFELPVGHAKAGIRYPGEPRVFASQDGDPLSTKAYIEGSLASDAVVPGDVIRAAVALINTRHNRYSKLTVSLAGNETLHDKRRRERREVRRLSVEVDTKNPEEGQSFDIAIRLPETLSPSARAALWSLDWAFEVVARIRLGRDKSLSVPITVVPLHARTEPAGLLTAPRVGSARQQALWETVAAKHGLEFYAGKMQGAVGEVAIEIDRVHRGRAGWALRARLRFPSVALGASISESSLLKGTSYGGIQLWGGRWGRDHFVDARSPTQAQPFYDVLAPKLMVFETVRMDDESLHLEQAGSGFRRGRLDHFVAAVLETAGALEPARAEIPAPPEFTESFGEWSEFAATLGSALEPGDMSIEGRYQGLTVRTSHRWTEGAVSATLVEIVGLIAQSADECFTVGTRGERPIDLGDLEGFDAGVVERLAPAIVGASKFASKAKEDWLELPPQKHPAEVKRRLAALARFSGGRAAQAGPYR